MAEALRVADLGRVGALLSENWRHQQALDPGMRTDEMARLEQAVAAAGVLGGKSAGSGAGVCPGDGAALMFDPWSPGSHACPRCRETYGGERHDRAWARYHHLWLAERAAHLAALGALADHRGAAARAGEILRAYAARYFRYPNRDNVLGPSRLFFSTYLESLWIGNVLAAAVLLRESGNLDEATTRAVNQVAEEAANLIGA